MSENRDHVKVHIETAIDRAREGLSERLDEIDRRIRGTMDVKRHAATYATNYAPQLAIGGAVLGFVVGFGFPTLMKRAIQFGVPILVAMKIAQMQSDGEVHSHPDDLSEYGA